MLDNLVESKSNSENTKRRGGYLLTTSVLVFSLFASGILWSLFAKNLEMGGDSMELSSMVAPVAMTETEPPKPEPIKEEIKQNPTTKVADDNVITRRENLASTSEPIQPIDISTKPNTNLSRPQNSEYKIGPEDSNPKGEPSGGQGQGRRVSGSDESGAIKNQVTKPEETEKDTPPEIKKKAEPTPAPAKIEKPKPPVSGGVLNGKAINLPKPSYPAAAKAIRVGGDVNVQVTIDEKGNVISASAVSGHALLKQVSEQAARSAKFSPTFLGSQPVKVTGLIVYKFAVQ